MSIHVYEKKIVFFLNGNIGDMCNLTTQNNNFCSCPQSTYFSGPSQYYICAELSCIQNNVKRKSPLNHITIIIHKPSIDVDYSTYTHRNFIIFKLTL